MGPSHSPQMREVELSQAKGTQQFCQFLSGRKSADQGHGEFLVLPSVAPVLELHSQACQEFSEEVSEPVIVKMA